MRIFLSHASQDKVIANKLKEWIDNSFLGTVEIFVSSNPNDLSIGEEWLNKIREALSEAQIIIVILSNYSIDKNWIYFECGAGWLKRIPIFPICISDINKSNLPSPLSSFQAMNLNDESFSFDLMNSLSKRLNFNKSPNIDFAKMDEELRTIEYELYNESDFGFLDYIESMVESIKSITEILNSFTDDMNYIENLTTDFADKINKANSTPSQGTPKYLKKLANQYSKNVDNLTSSLLKYNTEYNSNLNKLKNSFEFIFNYGHPNNAKEIQEFKDIFIIIENVYHQGSETNNAVRHLNDSIKSLPRYEKNMNKTLKKYSEALEFHISYTEYFMEILSKTLKQGDEIISRINQ